MAARSAAEMPVVVPCLASTDTVNAVRWRSVFSATISGSWSSSSRSPSSGMQITPLVWRIMNAIASGVTFSAAMMRSPSFSRSASSTTTTSSPRATAAMACLDLGERHHYRLLRVTAPSRSRSTYFASMSTSRFTGSPGSFTPRVVTASVCGMTATANPSPSTLGDGQAHAVDRDRALLDDVARAAPAAPSTATRVEPSGERFAVRRLARPRRRGPARGGRPRRSASRRGRSRFTGSPARERAEGGALEGLDHRVGRPPVRRPTRRRSGSTR